MPYAEIELRDYFSDLTVLQKFDVFSFTRGQNVRVTCDSHSYCTPL
jgi:hypothetical protein